MSKFHDENSLLLVKVKLFPEAGDIPLEMLYTWLSKGLTSCFISYFQDTFPFSCLISVRFLVIFQFL